GTSWTIGTTSHRCIAPSLDNTILYYATAGPNTAIKRWDLVNDVALSDLVAGQGAGFVIGPDLIVLADGSLIAFYTKTSPHDGKAIQFSAAGATLNTYTGFGTATIDHICSAIDDPNSFWLWLHNTSSTAFRSTFLNIKVSDGSYLSDI